MVPIEAFLEALTLEPVGEGRFRAPNIAVGHDVVFGGQLLAQSIVAGVRCDPEKSVKTLHTVFARGASKAQPVEIAVEPMHSGRSFGSATVTISQGERLCTRSIVLLSADEPDLMRHADEPVVTSSPDDAPAAAHSEGAWEVRVVDGVDITDPSLVGPPDLDVWTRFVGAPDDPVTNQALVAFATDGFLIGASMRPHEGIGQAMAHVSLATGVVSHTITFHERCTAGDWLLLANHGTYAGHGRAYGRAEIFQGGALVGSFVQDSMIREMPART
jgi:acyl-CoA thioesterase